MFFTVGGYINLRSERWWSQTIHYFAYNAVRAYFGGTKFHQTQNKLSSLWNYKKI